MTDWAALETPLKQAPRFPVEPPDGRKELTELDRQAWIIAYMRRAQPHVMAYATPNGGKRGMGAAMQAKREGMLAGVFDLTFAWDVAHAADGRPTVAWAEMKGYDKSGRPGLLSRAQIEWGNAMHDKGHSVACFYSAQSVIRWLAQLGAPLRGKLP